MFDASVIEGYVQPPVPLDCLVNESPDLIFLGHIGLDEVSVTTVVDFGSDRLTLFCAPTGENDIGTRLGELDGSLPTDA